MVEFIVKLSRLRQATRETRENAEKMIDVLNFMWRAVTGAVYIKLLKIKTVLITLITSERKY